jgi:hypothetical protein
LLHCVCASTVLLLFGFNVQKWNTGFHYLLLVWYNWEIHHHLCGIAQQIKAKAFLDVLCSPMSIFGSCLALNLQ